jgi:hypothetical protein
MAGNTKYTFIVHGTIKKGKGYANETMSSPIRANNQTDAFKKFRKEYPKFTPKKVTKKIRTLYGRMLK